jgi:glycosyltransferase involved in cell wall biosynthesis
MWIGFKIKILLKKKVIYDIHEDYRTQIKQKVWIPTRLLKYLVSSVFSVVEKFFCLFYDKLVFAEIYYKDNYSNLLQKKAIDILNYPLIENKVKTVSNKSEIKLIYTGNITKERGAYIMLDTLSELIKLNSNIKMYWIGSLKDENIISTIEQKSEFNDNLVVVGKRGYTDKDVIDSYVALSDFGLALFPQSEHYNKKLLTKFYEYMMYGIPVIASNFDVWKRFVKTNQIGITIEPENTQNIAKEIIRLIEDKELINNVRINSPKLIKDKYNWIIEERKLLKIYEELLSE